MVKVGEIMCRSVLTLQTDHTVEDAARMLADFSVSGAPVCDVDGKIVGVFSKTDVADRVSEGDVKPNGCVSDFMSPSVSVTLEDDELVDAVRMMAQQGVRRLPVLNAGGDLVGILTATDLLKAIADGRLPVTW